MAQRYASPAEEKCGLKVAFRADLAMADRVDRVMQTVQLSTPNPAVHLLCAEP
jgi:hypothetical protein